MDKQIDLKFIAGQTIQIVKLAEAFIRQESKKFTADKIEVKSLNSLVSYVDKGAEQILVDGLKKILPQAGFITEENTANIKAEFQWVIDPLDGTTNFIHKIPAYCVSVGLIKDGKEILGVVHEITKDECFHAWQNGGAFLNGKPIHVSNTNLLSESLIATGFPYENFDTLSKYLTTLSNLMQKTRGIRRIGSAALDLAYVACGRFDGFYEFNLNAWDVCGGACIVTEAGGTVTDFKSDKNYLFGREIIATNSNVHLAIINEI